MKPFAIKTFLKSNAIQKAFNVILKRNYLIELNNLLADNSLDCISLGDIQKIKGKYALQDPIKKFKNELLSMLIDFLDENLGNAQSVVNDYSSAKKMQSILCISEPDFIEVYNHNATEIFKKSISDLINKHKKFGFEERDQIEQLRILLNYPSEKVDEIIQECKSIIVQNHYSKIIEDERVSPDELKSVELLCENLGIQVNLDDKSRGTLDKYKKLWNIENCELPTIEPDVMLRKNEQCYLQCDATLFENRRVTKRVGYSGPTYRIKLAKGLYYRVGNVGINKQTEDVLTEIDSGKLYLTNMKILFAGTKQNKSIKYNQIIDLIPYSDGVEISKESGRSPVFKFSYEDGEIVSAIIARLCNDI